MFIQYKIWVLCFFVFMNSFLVNAEPVPFSAQETLNTLVQKGDLTLLETNSDGTLKQVTAMALIKAPIEVVWQKLGDYQAYLNWMPKVKTAIILKKEGVITQTKWEIEVPGPNYTYVVDNIENKSLYTIKQKQVSGALKGSHWGWQLVAISSDTTMVFRSVFTNVTDESWIVRQVEDESHTLSYGINVSSSLLEVKALKRVLEKK